MLVIVEKSLNIQKFQRTSGLTVVSWSKMNNEILIKCDGSYNMGFR